MEENLYIKELDLNMINPNWTNIRDETQGGSKLVIIGKPGIGKCMHPLTPVRLSDGKVIPIKDVKEGNKLLSDGMEVHNGFVRKNSTYQNVHVTSVTEGKDTMYRIDQSAAMSYLCNSEHIVCVYNMVSQKLETYTAIELYSMTNIRHLLGYKIAINTGLDYGNYDTLHGHDLNGRKNWLTNIVKQFPLTFEKTSEKIEQYGFAGRMDIYSINLDNPAFIKDMDGLVHRFTANGHIFTFINYANVLYPEFCRFKMAIFLILQSYWGSCAWPSVIRIHRQQAYLLVGIPSSVLGYKTIKETQLQFSFSHLNINVHKASTDYFGFELEAHPYFILSDGTVTHNTSLVKSLLNHWKDIIPFGLCMNGTEDEQNAYEGIFPPTFISSYLNINQIDQFKLRQKKARKEMSDKNPWGLLLLDDVTSKPEDLRKSCFLDIFKNGRHWKMVFILCLQYAMDVLPAIRVCIDGTFILHEASRPIRKKIYDNFASIIPSFQLFEMLMDEITKDRTALYIHNAPLQSTEWKDSVFWYKWEYPAPLEPFGCYEYWKHNDIRLNEQKDNDEQSMYIYY